MHSTPMNARAPSYPTPYIRTPGAPRVRPLPLPTTTPAPGVVSLPSPRPRAPAVFSPSVSLPATLSPATSFFPSPLHLPVLHLPVGPGWPPISAPSVPPMPTDRANPVLINSSSDSSLSLSSPHPVSYGGRIYATAAHFFHSLKFKHYPEIAEAVRVSTTPEVEAARHARYVRPEWERRKAQKMYEVLYLKYWQHEHEIEWQLLVTGDRELIDEEDPENLLGNTLMFLRTAYRRKRRNTYP